LNNSRTDIDWSRLHLGDLSSFEDAVYKVDQMVRRGQISLRAYNKANETTIQTLEDYYKIPEGKRNLDDIKESVLTGVPLNKIKQKRKKAIRQEQEQLDLFEDTTSGFVGGPALPLQSVQDLFDRLESATETTATPIDKKTQSRIESLEFVINDYETSIIPGYQQERKDLVSQKNLATNPALVEKLDKLITEYDDAIKNAVQTVEDTKRDLAKISEKIGKFVSEGKVSEETILDQLRKINSCFK
jgi:hypothetical protein